MRRIASSVPGTNASREVVSWRSVSVWPGRAEDHLLVGDEARQPDAVDGDVATQARGRSSAVPEGASRFVSRAAR